jgi:hypothetical protein
VRERFAACCPSPVELQEIADDPFARGARACDWVFVENGLIREVNAYYDSVTNRAALDG